MQTIRRIYFYLVAFISLQVVLWGSINLMYSLIRPGAQSDFSDVLAQGLAQIVVGLPIFFFHWIYAQRRAKAEIEERESAIRAVFFYGIRLTTLIVIFVHLYSVLQHILFQWMDLPLQQRLLFADNDFTKNFITIAANLLVWYLFERILKTAWAAASQIVQSNMVFFRFFRRLYSYLWASFHLIFLITGINFIFLFLLATPEGFNQEYMTFFANGLALILISLPMWIWVERQIAASLSGKEEKDALLRKLFTYITLFIMIAMTLTTLGNTIKGLVLLTLGELQNWVEFIHEYDEFIAFVFVTAVFWVYFQLKLNNIFTDARSPAEKAGLKRILSYTLSLAGTVLSYTGIWFALQVVTIFISQTHLDRWQDDLGTTIALLAVGLPLWLIYWLPVQKITNPINETDDTNRRSLLRRIYLYLIVFATVIGAMALIAALVYRSLNHAFGNPQSELLYKNLNEAFHILITGGWFWYHLRHMRRDGFRTTAALEERFRAFPVAILGKADAPNSQTLLTHFSKHAPLIPVQVLSSEALQKSDPAALKLLILSSKDLHNANEALKSWLSTFTGQMIIIPVENEQQHWVGLESSSSEKLLEAAVKDSIRFAEGKPQHNNSKTNAWAVIGYILVGLIVIWVLFALAANLLF